MDASPTVPADDSAATSAPSTGTAAEKRALSRTTKGGVAADNINIGGDSKTVDGTAETVVKSEDIKSAVIATEDKPLGVTRLEYRILQELLRLDGPHADTRIARRFPVSEREAVIAAMPALVTTGLCRRFSDGRFGLSIAGEVLMS